MNTAMAIIEQLKARGVFAIRLTADSRRVQPGDVFVAFPGAQVASLRSAATAPRWKPPPSPSKGGLKSRGRGTGWSSTRTDNPPTRWKLARFG